MSIRYFSPPAFLAVALLITGCATTKDKDGAFVRAPPLRTSTLITSPADAREGAGEEAKIFKGTGQLVKGQLVGGGLPAGAPGAVASGPAVTLNFEGADLRSKYPKGRDPIVLGESVNTLTTYGYDPATGMQEPKAALCQIRAA